MKITAVLFSALAVAAAQQQYTIDPNSVSLTIRNSWCASQTTQCPLICLQLPGSAGADKNDCSATSLQYNCVCTNGQTPNITEYTQTLPWYICTTWQEQCVSNCGHDNNCALACRTQHPCGAAVPKKAANTTSSSITSTATATGSATTTLSSTTSAAHASTSAASATTAPYTGAGASNKPMVIQIGQSYGLGVVVAALFGSFALLL